MDAKRIGKPGRPRVKRDMADLLARARDIYEKKGHVTGLRLAGMLDVPKNIGYDLARMVNKPDADKVTIVPQMSADKTEKVAPSRREMVAYLKNIKRFMVASGGSGDMVDAIIAALQYRPAASLNVAKAMKAFKEAISK